MRGTRGPHHSAPACCDRPSGQEAKPLRFWAERRRPRPGRDASLPSVTAPGPTCVPSEFLLFTELQPLDTLWGTSCPCALHGGHTLPGVFTRTYVTCPRWSDVFPDQHLCETEMSSVALTSLPPLTPNPHPRGNAGAATSGPSPRAALSRCSGPAATQAAAQLPGGHRDKGRSSVFASSRVPGCFGATLLTGRGRMRRPQLVLVCCWLRLVF